MSESKEMRQGGARDETEIYINYSRAELLDMLIRQDIRFGAGFAHDFSYRFKAEEKPKKSRRKGLKRK